MDFAEYIGTSTASARAVTSDFDDLTESVAANAPEPEAGEEGGCWLWLLDPFHPMARGLIKSGAAKVNKSGKYLARVVGWRGHSLRQRENMAKEVAARLRARYRLRATYFSVLGKLDPDRLPTFYGVLQDPLYFNH